MPEKTQAVIAALKAAKAFVKDAKTLEDAEAQIDGLLLVANATEDVEETQAETSLKIEYEQIAVKVPKLILDFLRAHEQDMGMTAKEYIEHNVISAVRSDLDAGDVFHPEAKELAENWNLNPIFKVLLNDPVTI